jgi:hypothetical protein
MIIPAPAPDVGSASLRNGVRRVGE